MNGIHRFFLILLTSLLYFSLTYGQTDGIAEQGTQVYHNPSQEELLGQIEPSTHADFVLIEAKYTDKQGIYMRRLAYKAFCAMAEAAKSDGIELKIISATRTFAHQKAIWERKWKRERYMGWQAIEKAEDILTYSSMPGSSRHHWGTDIDLNALNNEHFLSGQGKKTYDWLCANAASYGFVQVYSDKSGGRSGYNEEKWHWSYLPIAQAFLEAYNRSIRNQNITGFEGAETSEPLDILRNYVNGVSTAPLQENPK